MTSYRYTLNRDLRDDLFATERLLWCMLNPSTATETENDPTIRRCIGYSRAWGAKRMRVVNLYAARSTNPDRLLVADDPVGPDNDEEIEREAEEADAVIVAWGEHRAARLNDRDLFVTSMLAASCPAVMCLGYTKSGDPLHPLYLPADLKPMPFKPRETRS